MTIDLLGPVISPKEMENSTVFPAIALSSRPFFTFLGVLESAEFFPFAFLRSRSVERMKIDARYLLAGMSEEDKMDSR